MESIREIFTKTKASPREALLQVQQQIKPKVKAPQMATVRNKHSGSYLTNFKCPICGHKDSFKITAYSNIVLSKNSYSTKGGIFWNEDSYCSCPNCSFSNTLNYFDVTTEDYGLEFAKQAVLDTSKIVLKVLEEKGAKSAVKFMKEHLQNAVDAVEYYEESEADDRADE